MEGAFVPRHHHSSTHLKCKTAVLTDWQTWLERIQHCFTHCIVQDISNVINSKTAVKIETILKHSPANTSHYKLGLAINKTATAITNIFNHNCFPLLSWYTGYKVESLWSTANIYQHNEKDLRVQLVDRLKASHWESQGTEVLRYSINM